ncbi:hypothetical protein CKO15_01165 [Halorhodospira abdelmalekii]|uniref:hypothetical protein n=1 Tax=Halorhodospira abdelmalekii TaxID=421629 RepID=UPI0019088B41|nr:hypothetical protein [Halorhodospira abdelmalekii]MBK1733910.1 hypothetical protein [Halorhodospira abdelmalekii]
MSTAHEAIVGLGLFGTQRGLSARGGGALQGLEATPQALEFRGRGGDTSALPRTGEEVVFRRVVRVHGGLYHEEELDIIGVLASARDVSRRAGFRGACVAVRHARFDAYSAALEEARRLLDQRPEAALAELQSLQSAAHGAPGQGAHDKGAQGAGDLELLGGLKDAVRLHLEIGVESPDERIEEGLRQVAWLDAHHGATILLFYAPRPDSRPIDWALIRECRERKQAEIEHIEAEFHHVYELRLRELEREYAQQQTAQSEGATTPVDSATDAAEAVDTDLLTELEHDLVQWIKRVRQAQQAVRCAAQQTAPGKTEQSASQKGEADQASDVG